MNEQIISMHITPLGIENLINHLNLDSIDILNVITYINYRIPR